MDAGVVEEECPTKHFSACTSACESAGFDPAARADGPPLTIFLAESPQVPAYLDPRDVKAALYAEVVAVRHVQRHRGQLQHQALAALVHAVALCLVDVRLRRPDLGLMSERATGVSGAACVFVPQKCRNANSCDHRASRTNMLPEPVVTEFD